MARFKARLSQDAGGGWIAAAVELPNCWSRGHDRDEALAKLRDEIRYRIEYCPCTGVADDFVQVDVVPSGGAASEASAGRARDRAGDVATWRGVAGCPGGPAPSSSPASPTAPSWSPAPAPSSSPVPTPQRRRSRWSD
jgi:hypothetical protein